MTLAKEAYQALADIVGANNISDDPAVVDSYAYQWLAELFWQSKFMVRPEAVILPGNTEEVQAVIRTCNRYKIKVHAYSTGWGPWGAVQTQGTIQLDMRRMNRILQIDEQNMFAVVEPYVICAQLQAEAMKLGLNVHMIGAGASCSVLACHTYGGPGPDSIFMGTGQENLLGLEWVMPTGDVLRIGSLGSGAGWFYSDGPGPSLMGLARGATGLWGGLGVFTKCAVKLHPWPGPAVMPVQGVVPSYNSPLPENFRAYTLAFPSWQAYADAYYEIYESEIGYVGHRQFIQWGDELQAAMIKIVTDPTKQLCDLEELLKTPEVQKMTEEMKYSFQFVLAGMSPRDIKYQENVLNEILAETGGWKIAEMSTPHMERWVFLYLIKLCFKSMNWITGGGFADAFIVGATPDALFTSGIAEAGQELLRKYGAEGRIVDHGGDAAMGGLGMGVDVGACGFEPFVFYDPNDADSIKAVLEVMKEGDKIVKEWGTESRGLYSMVLPNVEKSMLSATPAFHWQRKIKEAFDPNGLGDGSYLCAEEPEK